MLDDLPSYKFGDSDEMADYLARLVAEGIKTATSWIYKSDDTISVVGERNIILDSKSNPLCIVETTEVRVIPFNQVDAVFAYDEGEGDRSLEYWRKEHEAFFSRNGDFNQDMLIVCERFKIFKLL